MCTYPGRLEYRLGPDFGEKLVRAIVIHVDAGTLVAEQPVTLN